MAMVIKGKTEIYSSFPKNKKKHCENIHLIFLHILIYTIIIFVFQEHLHEGTKPHECYTWIKINHNFIQSQLFNPALIWQFELPKAMNSQTKKIPNI